MTRRIITEADRKTWEGPYPEQRYQCYWSDARRERTVDVLRRCGGGWFHSRGDLPLGLLNRCVLMRYGAQLRLAASDLSFA